MVFHGKSQSVMRKLNPKQQPYLVCGSKGCSLVVTLVMFGQHTNDDIRIKSKCSECAEYHSNGKNCIESKVKIELINCLLLALQVY